MAALLSPLEQSDLKTNDLEKNTQEQDVKATAFEDTYNIKLPNHLTYQLIADHIGSGFTSNVYRVLDSDRKTYALKISVVHGGFDSSLDKDVAYLKQLRKYPWVVKLEGDWKTPCAPILPPELIYERDIAELHEKEIALTKKYGHDPAKLNKLLTQAKLELETTKKQAEKALCYFQLQSYYDGNMDRKLTISDLQQMCIICIELGKLKITHGDIKPDNFLYKTEGKTRHIVITDFQFATQLILNASKAIHVGWHIPAWSRRSIRSPLTNDEKELQSFATYFNLAQLFFSFQFDDRNVKFYKPDGSAQEYTRFASQHDPLFKKWQGEYPYLQVATGNVFQID
jgi:serine/threonine protein kinase